jgi:type II secretory pathway pseudopilin PulG
MKRLVFYLIAGSVITILVVMLIPAINSTGRPTQLQRAVIEMRIISDAMQAYRKQTGSYPTGQTENILQQLRGTNDSGSHYLLHPYRRNYSTNDYVDPWGTPYRIEVESEINFVIRSAGKNGEFGDRDDQFFDGAATNLANP